jgi:type I restriction enzyme S subunit
MQAKIDQNAASRWPLVRLGDVCEVIAGQSPEGKYYNNHGEGLPFHQGKKDFGQKNIESSGIWTSQITKIAYPGDILMSVRAPVGPINFTETKLCIGRGLAAIRSKKPYIDAEYLYLFLTYLQPDLSGREGAVFASINKSELENILLPLPPLAEQQRIVARLDAAFAAIAEATAAAEANLRNARALFDSYLDQVFSQRGPGWVERRLGDVGEVFDGPHATPKTVESGPVFLGISALKDGEIDLSETRHVSEEDFVLWTRRVIPKAGDFVFSYETRLGQAAIIPSGLRCCLGRRMGLIRFDESLIDVSFFTYLYISPKGKEYLATKVVSGATVDRFSIRDFPDFCFTIPDLTTQRVITQKINALQSNTTSLLSSYVQKITVLAELKQSLLAEVFGEG